MISDLHARLRAAFAGKEASKALKALATFAVGYALILGTPIIKPDLLFTSTWMHLEVAAQGAILDVPAISEDTLHCQYPNGAAWGRLTCISPVQEESMLIARDEVIEHLEASGVRVAEGEERSAYLPFAFGGLILEIVAWPIIASLLALLALKAVGLGVRSDLRQTATHYRSHTFSAPFLIALPSISWLAYGAVDGMLSRLSIAPPALLHPEAPAAIAAAVNFLTGTLTAPLCEEILFRGVLLGGLIGWIGWAPALLISSTAFGIAHGPDAWLGSTCMGVLFGTVYLISRSVTFCVVAHALSNLLVSMIAFVDHPNLSRLTELGFQLLLDGAWHAPNL
ncbi:lysostaphin resistance A-like protein [Silanimonas sp.]|jgi:membrane protease YdiL (CAAX protease family)|uniref:lysostaphin resistance A-like protein n=1 Tax=Silanimonas sp. TaxID=1929290 RepID=UPI0037C634F4